MKEVVSFRLETESIVTARTRAAAQGKKFTSYLEDLVMNDIVEGKAYRKSQPKALRILRILRAHREDLEKIGVRHADIFGSVARGEERTDSDVDILVDLDPSVVRDLFAYSRVQRTLQDLIGLPVDIARRGRLRDEMKADVARDGINAF
jgi:uncharacterized protein